MRRWLLGNPPLFPLESWYRPCGLQTGCFPIPRHHVFCVLASYALGIVARIGSTTLWSDTTSLNVCLHIPVQHSPIMAVGFRVSTKSRGKASLRIPLGDLASTWIETSSRPLTWHQRIHNHCQNGDASMIGANQLSQFNSLP